MKSPVKGCVIQLVQNKSLSQEDSDDRRSAIDYRSFQTRVPFLFIALSDQREPFFQLNLYT